MDTKHSNVSMHQQTISVMILILINHKILTVNNNNKIIRTRSKTGEET